MYRTTLIALASVILNTAILQAQLAVWSPHASAVVHIDTCSNVILTAQELDADTGLVFLYQACASGNGTNAMPESAGRWCLQHLLVRHGHVLQLDDLTTLLDVEAAVQIVPVITGPQVRFDTNVVVRPFDGERGGVLVVSADTITINASLDASGAGFQGGPASLNNRDTCLTIQATQWSTGQSGGRGLGPTSILDSVDAGSESTLLGGGGGNARNAGGGGGSGAGAGGAGGFQTNEYGPLAIGGRGGQLLTGDTPAQLLFGGGGGGGHQNDFMGSDGASGGGLIVLLAPVIKLTDRAHIYGAGASAFTAVSDGAGGGGGGGTVVLVYDTLVHQNTSTDFVVDVQGGSGGSTFSAFRCYGPGGGGGGGRVLCSHLSQLALTSIVVGGGTQGITDGTDQPCSADSSYGSEQGQSGEVSRVTWSTPKRTEPCGVPDLLITVHDTSSTIGSRAIVTVSIESSGPLASSCVLRLRLRARATVLWPDGAYWWAGRRYTIRYVDVQIPAGEVINKQLAVPYVCLLGDSAEVSVIVDSATPRPPIYRTQIVHNGVFRVENICTAGGRQRLFDPFGSPPQNVQREDNNEAQEVMLVDLLGRTFRKSDPHSSTSWRRQIWRVVPLGSELP